MTIIELLYKQRETYLERQMYYGAELMIDAILEIQRLNEALEYAQTHPIEYLSAGDRKLLQRSD